MRKRSLLLLVALFATGCQSVFKPGAAYIASDRNTFNAVQPFLENEKTVQPQKAQDIEDIQKSWQKRLVGAEANP